jgi:predicted type IV restriction endonuclease
VIDARRISLRDAQSYCAIMLDNNNRKIICRLRFTATKLQIGIMNEQKQEEMFKIDSLDDIYQYSSNLKAAVANYEPPRAP